MGATLNVPGITGTVQNLNVKLNKASTGAAFDWTTITTVAGLPSFTGAEQSAAGELVNLDVLGLLQGGAKFAVSRRDVSATVDGGAPINATLLTLWLSLEDAGDAYFLRVGAAGFGLQIDEGEVLVAALAPTLATDTRRWVAVQATGLAASLTLPLVTADLSAVSVELNRASGVGAAVIDWAAAIPGGVSVADSTGGLHTLDIEGDTFAVKGTLSNLSIAGLISGQATFELTQSSISLDTARRTSPAPSSSPSA